MKLCDLDDAQYGLLFDVWRSIRYHDRRRAFFEFVHRVTSALTILLAGGVIFELAGGNDTAWWLKAIGVLAAVLAAFDMVTGYSTRANLHAGLRVRFADLEIAMLSGGIDHETWEGYRRQRLQIERDEPPVYRALDLLCRNEVCRAEGIAPDVTLNRWQRLTSQLYPWGNIDPQPKT
jgi:hypothetical protein